MSTKGDSNRCVILVVCFAFLIQIISVRPGVKYREIGDVIQKIANANNLSVVRRFCGHGINRLFHTAPNVPHYSSESRWRTLTFLKFCVAENKAVGVMKAGNTFTIEPMIVIARV